MPAHAEKIPEYFARRLRKQLDLVAPRTTDADRVRAFPNDPIGFAREILGIQPWSRQAEILRAVLAHKRVAVVSGHKVGKSTSLAILALWFFCSFPSARVVITATTDRQVNGIIWREIRRLVRNARVPIPGAADIHVRASSGLDDPSDFSEIRGYTASEAEAIAGVSGARILYLVDEASGVAAEIFTAIEGNRAAGLAWVFLISNPTKADGEFYDAFHSKSKDVLGPAGYHTIRISSEESPNVTGEWASLEEWSPKAGTWRLREEPIPGMAAPEWIADKLVEWGPDSADFKIRIKGSFAVAEDAKVFRLGLLIEAQERWSDLQLAPATGRLRIGVDPAGDGDGGDESAFCARRGARVLELVNRNGLNEAMHLEVIRELIQKHNAPKLQPPVVCVDSEGPVGWRVYTFLRVEAERTGAFEVVRIRASDKAVRQPLIYHLLRDELWANAREWMRAGGAIPTHTKLEKDLHTPEFSSDIRGHVKLTAKKDIRKILGRSPDTGDAFVLSCWEPRSTREDEPGDEPGTVAEHFADDGPSGGGVDPYSGAMSPYG